MSKSQIFFWFSISFIAGIGARSFFEMSSVLLLSGVIISISLLTIFWKNKIAALAAFFILAFVFGGWILDRDLEKMENIFLDGKNIEGSAVVVKEPEKKDNYQKIIAHLESEKEKVLISTGLYPEYSYGYEINVGCVLKIPENMEDGFDYRMYLAKDDILYICDKAKIEKVGEGENNFLYSAILKIKNKLDQNIAVAIPQPEAALASGMLFGGSGAMSESVRDAFSRTGMTHIVAVSGYNVTIIAEYLVLLGIFLGLWRKQALWVAIFGIFLFVAMIGFPASAVRAGVMGTVLIWAMKNGRLSNSLNAIIFAGVVMLLLNPMLLRHDIGFQLSFLATLGIVLLSPWAERISLRKFNPLGISEIIFLSICAQVFVLPIIMHNFQTVSLVSLLANVLVLPIIPFSMLLSFLAAVFGTILPPAFNVFAWLAYLPLYYEIETINFLSGFSWASRTVENFGPMAVGAYYVILGGIVYSLKRKRNFEFRVKP
ncbi:MAG: internalization-related competence protein ComEC/Rec2 protein [Candidatus Moranbacteria bacterium GW2011_GWE1_49_15]|nr:MAG: internalization-related competence protein ComEC/Rec2 protein [Candidatus Moranbacteria bacterium GW2011_GWE2_47_10]KKW07018.1 MAG: internalization-related competence protein ComEC/Rec2 protein [Candidatus Moranbacteria bacterium GW2011_GWE1_49_15]HBP01491.1 hypothetical protein [Candidatus Moranbacteria bacterium]